MLKQSVNWQGCTLPEPKTNSLIIMTKNIQIKIGKVGNIHDSFQIILCHLFYMFVPKKSFQILGKFSWELFLGTCLLTLLS